MPVIQIKPRMRISTLVTIVGLIVVLAGLIAWKMWDRARETAPASVSSGVAMTPPSAAPAAIVAAVRAPAVKPLPIKLYVFDDSYSCSNNFRMTNASGGMLAMVESDGFVFRNESQSPITILKIMYNGEYAAKLATISDLGDGKTEVCIPSNAHFPKTLTIGDKIWTFHAANFQFDGSKDYTKDVIFIEVVTATETFKFIPGPRPVLGKPVWVLAPSGE